MSICKPSGLGKKEEREFVNREACIDIFKNALINIHPTEYSVLVYYGVAGSGKTRLMRKLLEITEEYNLYSHQKVVFAFIFSRIPRQLAAGMNNFPFNRCNYENFPFNRFNYENFPFNLYNY